MAKKMLLLDSKYNTVEVDPETVSRIMRERVNIMHR